MSARTPSIRDVARVAGVSTATVSRTLSAPEVVSETTREAVFRAIEETGYRVNVLARNLRKRETGAIAVLVPNLANPFFSSILSGIAEVMSEAGYNVLINDTIPFAQNEHHFPEFASKHHVDGLILLDGMLRQDALLNRGAPEVRPPMIFACEWSDRIERPSVTIDNVAASAVAVEHLLSLGHRRIGHVCGPPENVLTVSRLAGARRAMREAGLDMDPAWIYPGDYSLQSGAEAAVAWHGATHRPTAVFCASDVMAFGFIGELLRRGVRVPEDVSVVGFDDLEMAAHFVPSLTTIRQPRVAIGRAAARMLLQRMQLSPTERVHGPVPREVLPIELVVRESTAPPPAAT